MSLAPLTTTGRYRYRPLKQGDKGWDVLALQTALAAVRHDPGGADGDFGPRTHEAVRGLQERMGLIVDGIAGVVTHRAAALQMIWPTQRAHRLPPGLMRGQVEYESAFLLGNHGERYGDGWYDVGLTQRSTRYTPIREGFDAPASLEALGKQLRAKYDEYQRLGKVTDERRLWELAAGSWNAPAWADRLARGQSLSESQRAWIEEYIDRATIYLRA